MSARNADNSVTATDVLSVIARLSASGAWTGSQAVLARECGISVRTLARRLVMLRESGQIIVTGAPGRKCAYSVNRVEQNRSKPKRRLMNEALTIMSGLLLTIRGLKPKFVKAFGTAKRQCDVKQLLLDFEKDYSSAGASESVRPLSRTSETVDARSVAHSGSSRSRRGVAVGAIADDVARTIPSHNRKSADPDCGTPKVGSRNDSSQHTPAHRSDVKVSESVRRESPSQPESTSRQPVARRGPVISDRTSDETDTPCDPIRSKFKLPRNTTPENLRSLSFLRVVFDQAHHLKCVTLDDWTMFVGLVCNILDVEPDRPAALLTWTMRRGVRITKVGTKSMEIPWRASVRMEDEQRARSLIHSSKAAAVQRISTDFETECRAEQAKQNRDLIAEFSRKFPNIAK